MADISMCKSKKCPIRMKCRRYTSFPNEHMQAYGFRNPDKCDDFIDNTDWPIDYERIEGSR